MAVGEGTLDGILADMAVVYLLVEHRPKHIYVQRNGLTSFCIIGNAG